MEIIAEEILKISKKKIASIAHDPAKTAAAIHLVYVTDTEPGIARVKKGKDFKYLAEESQLKDEADLQRIRSLVIPPAWENVWICRQPNGHLQATGLDVKNRKQYRYHALWNALRNHTKYYRLHAFGEVLPAIRLRLEKDLSLPGLPLEKVLAAIVSLMERTHIRIGNNFYEKLYGSFGLSTLKDKHVAIAGNQVRFTFKGKKGVHHDISIKNKKLAAIVQKCKDIPGKELFQYYDDNGEKKSVDSGTINEYIKTISGSDFTAKDFRTWAGTVQAFLAFKELGFFDTVAETKKKIVEALDMVSKDLGNTRTVCKKYYVHPGVINLYENKGLEKYIQQLDAIEKDDDKSGLTREEKIVMKILENA
jgi:DNA topoisomerase I